MSATKDKEFNVYAMKIDIIVPNSQVREPPKGLENGTSPSFENMLPLIPLYMRLTGHVQLSTSVHKNDRTHHEHTAARLDRTGWRLMNVHTHGNEPGS